MHATATVRTYNLGVGKGLPPHRRALQVESCMQIDTVRWSKHIRLQDGVDRAGARARRLQQVQSEKDRQQRAGILSAQTEHDMHVKYNYFYPLLPDGSA